MKIFITGSSDGIGKELVKQMIKAGHSVWGIARRKEQLEKSAEEINSDKYIFQVCDISNNESIRTVLDEMERKDFVPDVVILNAAIFPNDITEGYNHTLAKTALDTNINGSLAWIHYWLPIFLKRVDGQFITICSTAAFRGNLRGVAYPASKAFVAMLFRGLNLRYKKKGLLFSTIYFGPIATKMWEGKKNIFLSDPPSAANHIARVIQTKKSQTYFPFLSTSIFRISKFLPDRIYSALSEKILK